MWSSNSVLLSRSCNGRYATTNTAVQLTFYKAIKIIEACTNLNFSQQNQQNSIRRIPMQVAKLEQQLSSEGAKAKRLIFEMEEKLDVACRELDTKKRQYTELNGALKCVFFTGINFI